MGKTVTTFIIEVRGLVQGVGFRPFVYRLAQEHGISGWVQNRRDAVLIHAQGSIASLGRFIHDLRYLRPPLAEIEDLIVREEPEPALSGFNILESSSPSPRVTRVSPDLAVCGDCLSDMMMQAHRIDYPFINCTYCGPRFSIIRSLPYDRANTTMSSFDMCPECRSEYNDIADRRFHAQPVACRHCGPQYRMEQELLTAPDDVPARVAALIDDGKLLAIKGMGGYFLACDALNEGAVSRLRSGKNRNGKPFAVMFRDLQTMRRYASASSVEVALLCSNRRPILLLREREALASSVSLGFGTVGGMLPYMPFHYLLFRHLRTPVIVLTSGNRSEEPIAIDEASAASSLAGIADGLVSYNREIHNRVDDSVLMVVNRTARFIRRSRGYAPQPISTNLYTEGIFAAGAELVNTFAIGKDHSAVMSQHIGDLKNAETMAFYRESAGRFANLFQFTPESMVCDMHPDYLSSRYVQQSGVPYVQIQHHHAHIASCMAEKGLDERVIGVVFDGTGLGSDGHIWGGEFMEADLLGFRRRFHLEYLPMPGGDAAVREPWRMALSLLFRVFGESVLDLDLPFVRSRREACTTLIRAIRQNINCPLSSGAGRLFDAVAALCGLCENATFHAEAPMRLEAALRSGITSAYSFELSSPAILLDEMVREMLHDLKHKVPVGVISSRFHNTMIRMIAAVVGRLSAETGIRKVILSGGSFQNRYLLGKLEVVLSRDGLEVYSNQIVPANDGGIALGQLAIAAKMRACHVSEYSS